MPKSIGEVHVNVPLSNVAVKYADPAFVGEQIFPVISVSKEADKYWKFGREFLRTVETRRAIGAKSNRVDWQADPVDYTCEEEALSHLVPDRVRDNADAAIKPAITSVQFLTSMIRRGAEKAVQSIAQSATLIPYFHNVVTPWDADSGQDPHKDVDQAKRSVRQNCGKNANTILMNEETSQALLRYLKSLAYTPFKEYADQGVLPPRLWGLKPVIAYPIEDTSMEGQTSSISDIWDDNVLVAYIDTAGPSLQSLTLGWTIRAQAWITRDWRDEESRGTVYETSVIQIQKLVCAECGYLCVGALTGTGS